MSVDNYYAWIRKNPPTDGEICSEYYKKYCEDGGAWSENSFNSAVMDLGWYFSKSASTGIIRWRRGSCRLRPRGWVDC